MYLVLLGVDVGHPPAAIASECSACSDRLLGWLRLNHLAARKLDARGGVGFTTTEETAEMAQGIVDSYALWHGWAIGGRDADQHLTVMVPVA